MSRQSETENRGSIGDRIRQARKAAGLNQSELAQRIGVSQPAIATWESGVHDPRRVVMAKLADALSISPEWLTAGARSSAEADPQAAAAYLRRPVRHVPVISYESAATFAANPNADPHQMAEDYISVTARAPLLFALFVEDDAVDLAFPKGTLVVIDYGDRWPADGNYCLAAVNGAPLVRRLQRNPSCLEASSSRGDIAACKIDETVEMIGCVRVSIRFH